MNGALRKGTFCSVVSALVFGFTPVLASITFDMGSNAMTLTFYRNALAVPVLLVILPPRKVDLRIGLKDFWCWRCQRGVQCNHYLYSVRRLRIYRRGTFHYTSFSLSRIYGIVRLGAF